MQSNAKIITILGAAFAVAVLLRLTAGPWGASTPGGALYADAKIGRSPDIVMLWRDTQLASRAGILHAN